VVVLKIGTSDSRILTRVILAVDTIIITQNLKELIAINVIATIEVGIDENCVSVIL
jgi:hypothetical protein